MYHLRDRGPCSRVGMAWSGVRWSGRFAGVVDFENRCHVRRQNFLSLPSQAALVVGERASGSLSDRSGCSVYDRLVLGLDAHHLAKMGRMGHMASGC